MIFLDPSDHEKVNAPYEKWQHKGGVTRGHHSDRYLLCQLHCVCVCVLACVCVAEAPLAAAILSSQCDMEPKHSDDPERDGEAVCGLGTRGPWGGGEAVTLDLSVFPSKSGLLFISNDAETVKHDL